MTRPALAAAVCALAIGLAACGDDDSNRATAEHPPAAEATDLAAIKDYLLEHTERLVTDSGAVRQNAEDYYKLAKSTDFDYGALLDEHRAEVQSA